MCNAAINKTLILLSLPLLLGSMSVTSCSGNGDKDKAEALLSEATTACDAGKYELALSLTDSLKRAYPEQIDTRRKGLHITAKATEGLTLRNLERADSTLAVLGERGDSLSHLVKWVNNPIEGYYVAAGASAAPVSSATGLYARVSPEGDFYLISVLKSPAVKSTSVTVSCGADQASTATVAHDGERNDRSMGAEVITFIGSECDDAGRFIADHAGQPVKVTFNGQRSHSATLSSTQAAEIATLYNYATTVREAKIAAIEKTRLERMLDTARSQAARTFVESDSVK